MTESKGKLKKLCCGWCDFEAGNAEDIVTHMLATGHGLNPELAADLKDSGGFDEFVQVVAGIQSGRLQGDPIDDEEIPDEVKEALKASQKRHDDRKNDT